MVGHRQLQGSTIFSFQQQLRGKQFAIMMFG